MFNIFHYDLKKVVFLSFLILLVISCKKEFPLTFSEEIITSEDHAIIEIVYPKASGSELVSNAINKSIENHISNSLNFDEEENSISFKDAVNIFNSNYIKFTKEFPESSQKWEALVDGEVVYESPDLICIAIHTYIDTGGAHGNGSITFFNFNPENGLLFTDEDLIKDSNLFKELVQKHFIKHIDKDDDKSLDNYFFEDDFQLPSTLGFSDEGVIILYNTYQIAAYSEGITEFTIPYNEVNSILKIN